MFEEYDTDQQLPHDSGRPVIKYYKPRNPPVDMIHIEWSGKWVNYSLAGVLLSRSDSEFPSANLVEFVEIDSSEVVRLAPTVLARIRSVAGDPQDMQTTEAYSMDCPKCATPMAAGEFCIHGDLKGWLLAGWSLQSLYFTASDLDRSAEEVKILGYEGAAASGWYCEACGTSVLPRAI